MVLANLFILIAITNSGFGQNLTTLPNGNLSESNQEPFIVGGHTVTIDKYPYQVSLQFNGRHICGATIVSKKNVITAAHCIAIDYSRYYSIRAGTSFQGTGGLVYDVNDIVVHPSFSSNSLDYDVAVVTIRNSFSFGSTIKSINLASSVPSPGTRAVVTGWGRLRENGPSSYQLQALNQPTVRWQTCYYIYRRYGYSQRMLCAGNYRKQDGVCQGDSGGPLVSQGNLIGIVSWGIGCARPGYPAVYANVPALFKWIVSNLNK